MQDKRDIAAYIADVPKVRRALVGFVASATDTETAPVALTFGNAVTATSPLTINSVGITGASAADFLIKTGTTCANNLVLTSGQTCLLNVTFRTATGTGKTAFLSVN